MKIHALAALAGALVAATASADGSALDQEWVLKPKEAQAFQFTIAQQSRVHVDADPVKSAAKGFTVRIVPADDYDACRGASQGQCRSVGEFDGFAVASLHHTGVLPPGRWVFYAANTENLLERATVHVRLVLGAP